MSLADELERLERLRQAGSLSEEEFQAAKADLIANPPTPSSVPAEQTSAPTRSLDDQRRQVAMFLHFGLLAGLVVPFAGLIVPIVVWMMNKERFPELRPHWVVVANWLISEAIYLVVGFILLFVLIGFIIVPVVGVLGIVFPIIGGIKASEGTVWKYPLSIPFLKP
jgi:uncharacterized Tic20 family protein